MEKGKKIGLVIMAVYTAILIGSSLHFLYLESTKSEEIFANWVLFTMFALFAGVGLYLIKSQLTKKSQH